MSSTGYLATRTPPSNSLYDVVDVILDKGLVIDAFVRVSLVGIELLTIDARIVVASVDTYLRFAEAVDRLNLREQSEEADLGDMIGGGGGGGGMAGRMVSHGIDKAKEALTPGDEDQEESEERESEEAES